MIPLFSSGPSQVRSRHSRVSRWVEWFRLHLSFCFMERPISVAIAMMHGGPFRFTEYLSSRDKREKTSEWSVQKIALDGERKINRSAGQIEGKQAHEREVQREIGGRICVAIHSKISRASGGTICTGPGARPTSTTHGID